MDCCDTEKDKAIGKRQKAIAKREKPKHEHNMSAGHCGNGSGGGSGMGMDHGSAGMYLRRFWIVTALLVPLLFTNEKLAGFLGLSTIPFAKWIGFAIATIIFGFALVFFQHAMHEIRAKKYGMMTLVSLAVGAGYIFSVASTFIPALEAEFYLEISTLVWVLLFGHFLEAKSGSAAGDALSEVAKLLPKNAHRIVNGETKDVELAELKKGDLVLVKPGEKIPADGIIVEGSANINESHISGESKPIKKREGDKVMAGSICEDGSLKVELSEVGENSTVGQIKQLISQAQKSKPRSQKIADKAAGILTFVAFVVSIITLLVWSLVLGEPFVFSITLAITVLVIACPHALGLAIPTVTTISTSLAVKNGLFIKDLSKIEIIRKADYVIFDKTGTLTEGEFGVSKIESLSSITENDLLSIAGSLEKNSSHMLAQAIVEKAEENNLELKSASNFKNISGKGVSGEVGGETYYLGNFKFVKEAAKLPKEKQGSESAVSKIFLAKEGELLGLIELSDKIKEESAGAIEELHEIGVKVAMLTGDNEAVAKEVAKELKIDTYFAEVLPEDKFKKVQELQSKGNIVLMVGDGVNDAPALTQSDAGIAIGAGTDVAVEAGDVVLMKNKPSDVFKLIKLSRAVYKKMIQNLIWALGYNVVAIPAAAGVFAAWGFFLRPEIGALVMSLSTVIVVINAMALKRVEL